MQALDAQFMPQHFQPAQFFLPTMTIDGDNIAGQCIGRLDPVVRQGLLHQTQHGIDAVWDVVYGLVMLLIAWRLAVGARAAFASGENTMVLQWPSYWPIGLCAALAALVAAAAFVSAARLLRGSA